MTRDAVIIEAIGWISTALFLVSILLPRRIHLHAIGVLAAITTGIYAFAHGATAIWVKWAIALVFHSYMWRQLWIGKKTARISEP